MKGTPVLGWGVKSIDIDELARRLERSDVILVDVREPYEFAEGHVPGAINMPLGSLPQSATSLDPRAETLLICRAGHRSVTATKLLTRAGFTNAINVRGGTTAWKGGLDR